MLLRAVHAAATTLVLVAALAGCASGPQSPAPTSAAPEVLTVTPTGMAFVDAISHDARWIVGNEPRPAGSSTPTPLVRMDRSTGEQVVLCDWADPDLGYCSLAEQGGIVPERPTTLLVLRDDSVAGWFPSEGVHLVDSGTGVGQRIDTDSAGAPLVPAWQATDCEGGCDYHAAPYLSITTDSVSADGRVAAFCANYEQPRQPELYVKDLATGALIRTAIRCGVDRFGRESDTDEFADEAMSHPQVSADGSVVHVTGDRSSGGEYGFVGWQPDTLYFPGTGERGTLPGSGGMTRDGRTAYLRIGTQPELPEAEVIPEWGSYDVATGVVTALPWLREFVTRAGGPQPVLDTFEQASADGRLVLNGTAVRDVVTGVEVDIASLLRGAGHVPTSEWGPLRISGDASTIVAPVIGPDPLAEAPARVMLVTGWGWQPMARARVTVVDEQSAVVVDVDPDDAAGTWTVQVERSTEPDLGMASTDWELLAGSHLTEGAANTVRIDLPAGVYRVRVPAAGEYRGCISEVVWLAE